MPSFNKVMLIGRLTRDPELRYTANGLALAQFSIAVDRPFKDQATGERKTDFFRCKAWRQKAEFVNQYVQKGRLVAVDGRIETSEVVGQDGQKRYFTDIICDNVETLDSPRDSAGEAAPSDGFGYSGGGNHAAQNGGGDDGGYFADEEPAPAPPRRQAAPQAAAPAPRPAQQPQRAAAPAAAARPTQRPAAPAKETYPADDDFDDSDPFADE
ncbi:MAG: single-stranded DNA-binding protein [Armatimonadetes bacterium]|nr:single-stranded DNA-binding protein [Armatimonadota bacterium]